MSDDYLVISYCKKKEDEDNNRFHLVSFDDNYNLKLNDENISMYIFPNKEESENFKIFLENIHKEYEFKMVEVNLISESFI